MMNYACDKFGDCNFNRFGFIMRITITHRDTDTHTDRQTRMIALLSST